MEQQHLTACKTNHCMRAQVEERSVSADAALQLAALLSHSHNFERARGILERCLREQQQQQQQQQHQQQQRPIVTRTQALLGWVVLLQQLAEPPGERDSVEIAAAGRLFEAAISQDPGNLDVSGC